MIAFKAWVRLEPIYFIFGSNVPTNGTVNLAKNKSDEHI